MKRESYSRVATYIVTEACQNSESGNYIIEFEEVEKFFGIKITEDIYNKVCERIMKVYDKVVAGIEDVFKERVFDINIYTDFLLDYDYRGWGSPNDDEDDENYFNAERYEEEKPDYSKLTLQEVIEKEGWSIISTNEDGEIVCIENSSPLGEDLVIETYDDTDDIYSAINREWEAFDVDEHVSLYVDMRGTRGVPNSIEDLVNDANDIEKMLESLFNAVNNWYRDNKER